MTLTIDVHILQSVPPSNLNRDESGRPKSAFFGGVPRARVSSQAWKRATREHFAHSLTAAQSGVRTLRAADLIADRLMAGDPELDRATALKSAIQALGKINLKVESKRGKAEDEEDPGVKTEYLVFFSNEQLDGLAALAASGETKAAAYKTVMRGGIGVDLALFGRMVANDAELNVDASVQVAHALSTHAVESEFDFYTAVDDEAPNAETGAGMMGTIEFNSSVLYRFASINVDLLASQLASEADVVTAVREFVRSFVESMPTGKQNTFANNTVPDGVIVTLRDDRSISFVSAFEEPVRAGATGGYLAGSADALVQYAKETAAQYAAPASATWVVRVGDNMAALDALSDGDRVTLPELINRVGDSVAGYVSQP
jgi:CRISPR system Cascade subunit CasC